MGPTDADAVGMTLSGCAGRLKRVEGRGKYSYVCNVEIVYVVGEKVRVEYRLRGQSGEH